MIPAIKTEKLSRRFGRMVAIDEIDLAVPQGAIYALVGANGAGKTTLIKLLMNIHRPTSGSAQVSGIDSRRLTGSAFEQIGYVSENQEMPDWMTVGSMLNYFRAFYPRWDRALEEQLVRHFALPLHRKLKHLSRGERMKASFASSLAYRPSLIVLDEPFSGLDPLVRDELIEGLLERAPETTIFLSSHDLAEIESFSSHIGFLDHGKLLFSEELSALTDRFRDVTITLDSPCALPGDLPGSWLETESTECVIHFVDSRYQPQMTEAKVTRMFPAARDCSFDPMPLRAIFLAIARSVKGHSQFNIPTHAASEVEA